MTTDKISYVLLLLKARKKVYSSIVSDKLQRECTSKGGEIVVLLVVVNERKNCCLQVYGEK